jgi:ribonuclease T1
VKLLAALLAAGVAFAAAGSDIAHGDLPPQAQQTLALIEAGGPFPYVQDGRVFSNREAALPLRKRGYYREYTVPTPGVRSRGARRLIAGRGGEYYYTEDHYRTFRRIRE